jgi:hypothetical protein
MTATNTATLIGPDVHNQYRLHTDRMTILFFVDPADDPPGTGRHTRVFVDPKLAEADDPVLAALADEERALHKNDMWSDRGVDSGVDQFYDQLNDRYVQAFLRLANEAVGELAAAVDPQELYGEFVRAVQGARFDRNACWDGGGCRCTPGVILGTALFLGHLKIRIEVDLPSKPDTGEIPDVLLDEFTEFVIAADGLDITLDDAREGHHRAEVYRELARRAYAAGRASVR